MIHLYDANLRKNVDAIVPRSGNSPSIGQRFTSQLSHISRSHCVHNARFNDSRKEEQIVARSIIDN